MRTQSGRNTKTPTDGTHAGAHLSRGAGCTSQSLGHGDVIHAHGRGGRGWEKTGRHSTLGAVPSDYCAFTVTCAANSLPGLGPECQRGHLRGQPQGEGVQFPVAFLLGDREHCHPPGGCALLHVHSNRVSSQRPHWDGMDGRQTPLVCSRVSQSRHQGHDAARTGTCPS